MEATQAQAFTTDDILNDSSLREKLISRMGVLDKVKTLLLISYNEMATAKQVANYYEVSDNMLRMCIMRNRDELKEDGIIVMASRDFREQHHVAHKKSFRGYALYEDAKGNEFVLSSSKTMFLSKRAILRIGMLLRDSDVAREVRTQLLNIEERASEEQKAEAPDEEKELILKTVMSDTVEERCVALADYRVLKDRHIKAQQEAIDNLTAANGSLSAEKDILNAENDALARKEMDWTPRAILEKLIRTYAAKGFRRCSYSEAATHSWQRFYDELYYDYRISLASRRKRSMQFHSRYLDFVREEEWPVLVAKAFAMCRRLGCDVAAIIGNDVVMERIEQSVREAAQFVPQPEAAMAGN